MLAFLPALALLAAAPPAPAADDDRNICVTVAHIWRGSIPDTRAIRAMPVPESFRRPFHAGGCTRFSLVEESLLAWHLAYGDEASATAALAFLEADYTAATPAPDAFPAALAAARRDAERDISAATALNGPAGPDYFRAERALASSPRIARLRSLVLAQQSYMFLAGQYLRAADFYGSPALYEKARTYFLPAREGFRLLYGDRPPMADAIALVESRFGLWTHHINEMRALDMGMAVLEARLSRTPDDIDAAGRLLSLHYDEVLRQAGERVLEGNEMCDTEGRADLGALRAACDRENSLSARAVAYWVAQARLDLLMAANPAEYGLVRAPRPNTGSGFGRLDDGAISRQEWPQLRTFERAMRLLAGTRHEVLPETGRRYDGGDDAHVALRMERADLYARLAAAIPAAPEGRGGQQAYLAQSLLGAALYDLASAGRIAAPAEMPGRFRQIATRYLAIEADARARSRVEAGADVPLNPDQARGAAYMRRTLAALDAIAVGDDAR